MYMPLKYHMLQTIGSKSTRNLLTIKMLCSGQDFLEKKNVVFSNKDEKVKSHCNLLND